MIENKNIYVGNRYVPKIMGEWNKQETYEGLSIVTFEGTSYTSKKGVPIGVDILNETYWVVTGNYNAQIEIYRQEVKQTSKDLTDYKDEVTTQLTQTQTKTDWVDDRLFQSLQEAVDYACGENKDLWVHLHHDLSSTLVIPNKLKMYIQSEGYIKAVSEMEFLVKAKELFVVFDGTMDGNFLATNILGTEKNLPRIYRTKLINCEGDALITDIRDSFGAFVSKEAKAIKTGRGFMVYGRPEDSTVQFENNETSETTGNPYYFQDHKVVTIRGGSFKDSEGGVNAGYKCETVYVEGGLYERVYRGATLGLGVKYGHVLNTLAIDCGYAGVSIDTKLADGSIPDSDIEVTGNIAIRCNISMRIQSRGTRVDGNISKDHTGDAAFHFADAEAILGINSATGGNGRMYIFSNSTISKNVYPSNANNTHMTNNSTVIENTIESFTASGNMGTVTDIVLLDTTNGGFTVRLPRYYQAIGKIIKIIKISNDGSLGGISTLDGSTINGETTIGITEQWGKLEIFWNGSGWIAV